MLYDPWQLNRIQRRLVCLRLAGSCLGGTSTARNPPRRGLPSRLRGIVEVAKAVSMALARWLRMSNRFAPILRPGALNRRFDALIVRMEALEQVLEERLEAHERNLKRALERMEEATGRGW